jgi:CheY-like chemotaxis protein
MSERATIALIDDNKEDIEVYGRLLEQQGNFDIIGIDPKKVGKLENLTDLASMGKVDAIVVDQRLDELSGVGYDGIDVADFLRSLRPEIPIYILTQYHDDLGSRAMTVESIVDKKEFNHTPDVYAHRILRAAQRYKEALSEKQRRIIELVDMKTRGTITHELEEELEKLRAEVERVETLMVDRKLRERQVERSEESKLLSEALEQLRRLRSKLPDEKNKG